MIDDLMDYAARAAGLNTGAGMMAAARLLAEAARLRGLLGVTAALEPPPPLLEYDEWVRRFAPRESWPAHVQES